MVRSRVNSRLPSRIGSVENLTDISTIPDDEEAIVDGHAAGGLADTTHHKASVPFSCI